MLIVQKFGGTSLGDLTKIAAVAERVVQVARDGAKVVVVVSAMAGETNRLLALAQEAHAGSDPLFQDLLLATGEQVTVALLSMAIEKIGGTAHPFLGHQVRIVTDEQHGRARIRRVDDAPLQRAIASGKIPIVAGFQGVTESGAITTIGRGGSDTTAVALAAALRADRCEIYTDVAGVYTADPRIVSQARLLPAVSYEEMLELADTGAKVLQSRSVEIAARAKVPLVVRSTFEEGRGTHIVSEEGLPMEDILVSGITLNMDEAKVAMRRVPDRIGSVAAIFRPIAAAGIFVDMILQNVSQDGFTDLTFTVPKDDLKRAMLLAETAAREVDAGKVEAAGDIAKVSVIGVGMRTHAGVAHRMFEALARAGIPLQMISTSEIKVSIVTDMKYGELAVRILHDVFSLGER